MKKLVLIAVLLITGFAQAQKVKLTVEMSGFKNNDGKVKVGLYNSEGNFLKAPIKSLAVEIKDGKAKAIFEGIDKGEYAVSIYHDENNNGTLDKNMMGIPSEGYASSNNAKGFMGPPSYSDAKFTIQANSTIKMTINN
jgi:uncharacterized protein (DUF2141 family)